MTAPPAALTRPSTWFSWHAHHVRPGSSVLDVACGTGRHAIAAALLGARVTGVDRDADALAAAAQTARGLGVPADFITADLERELPALGVFEAVLVFNYLDRMRMEEVRARVAPGGVLIMETFLAAQRDLGWGPTSDDHLLRPGELAGLARPFEILHGREVLEPVGGDGWRAVASVVARRPTP